MKKKLIIVVSIAIVILAAIFILGYNTENRLVESNIPVNTNNVTNGKEITVFLHDGVGASDNP